MKKRAILSALFSGKPVHLILQVTNRCNLRCKTCFVNLNNDDKTEITLDDIGGISRYLGGLIWLSIGGGEPFLRMDLVDICAKFNAGLIAISTNGFDPGLIYVTAKKIRERVDAELVIAVSIDGFEKTNDEIRAAGCFNKSIETIKLLKTVKGIKIKVNTVLCKRNYSKIIDFMKFVKGLDVDFHSIILLRGVPFDPAYEGCSYTELQSIKADLFAMWDRYGYGLKCIAPKILHSYHKVMYETSMRIMKEKRQIPGCLAWRRHLVVFPTGDVGFCEMLKPFGNLGKSTIRELLNSEEANNQRKLIKNKGCYCHHNCNLIDNFLLNPMEYPKLLKGAWRK